MNHSLIRTTLESSLSDERLDRDEKHELHQLLATLETDDKRFLRNQAFDLVRDRLDDENALPLIKWLERIIKLVDQSDESTPVEADAYFSPGTECRSHIIRRLEQARKRVDICVFTISDNYITDAILAAHRKSVDVRIITDNDKANDRGSDIDFLVEQGVPVRVDRTANHMHHKFALMDEYLINGSFNWTRSASERNQENIVVHKHPQLVRQFDTIFLELWQRFA